MQKSNISFNSNVFPIKKGISTDAEYLKILVDYDRLKYLKLKYFSAAFLSDKLSALQNEIVSQGTLCNYSKNDPCWGLSDSGYICKCVNIDCEHFEKCRPTFDEEEYFNFSPDMVDTSSQYNYSLINTAAYYPVFTTTEIINYKDNIFSQLPLETNDFANKVTFTINTVEALRKNNESETDICLIEDFIEITDQYDLTGFQEEIDEDIPQRETEAFLINEKEKVTNTTIIVDTPLIGNIQNITDVDKQKLQGLFDKDVCLNIFKTFSTIEQDGIINADSKENIFVNAGPGTGKTYSLIKRINHLVTELEIDPEAIMVLCFTNAAVAEIRNRLREFVKKGGSRGLRKVDVRTFHSFAWWLIGEANEEFVKSGWHAVSMDNINFDKSIEIATNIIRRFGERIFEGWEHFFVDEIQDLTDVRADLVLHMTGACLKYNCGISVFGDSCQAIYDYTQKNHRDGMDSEQFYNSLYRQFQNRAHFYELDYNHRQTDDLKVISTDLRKSILENDKNETVTATIRLLSDITVYEKTSTKITEEDLNRIRNAEKVCLICRNNAEVLNLSSNLWQNNIPHSINVYDSFDNYAAWIANIFCDYNEKTISEEKFIKIFSEKVNSNHKDGSQIWNRLKEIMRLERDSLCVDELLRAIKISKIDDTIFRMNCDSNIIVSNIHKAKGREYQSVILDRSFVAGLAKNENEMGEYKALYVAITRPKHALFLSDLTTNREYKKVGRERWGKYLNSKLSHFEFITKQDADKSSFQSKNQTYIQNNVKIGDEILLIKDKYSPFYGYNIVHSECDVQTVIGIVTKNFSDDLKSLVRPKTRSDMPAYIDKLYVSDVLTYIADNPAGSKTQYSVWCWIKFNGIGHLNYDIY